LYPALVGGGIDVAPDPIQRSLTRAVVKSEAVANIPQAGTAADQVEPGAPQRASYKALLFDCAANMMQLKIDQPFDRAERLMLRIVLTLACVLGLLEPEAASAWGYQGHRVVGSIAGHLLTPNAAAQVQRILNEDNSHELDLRKAGPWADCVKSVVRHDNGSFEYVVDPNHLEFEVPCTPFKSEQERARMVDFAGRNWLNCDYRPDGPDKPPGGCHNTFHFDDVAPQRDRFDRSFQGTNDHDLVAAISAAIAVLQGKPAPPPFSIRDKKEALLMLTHFMGDLHQPLHVASIYLDADGKLVDPDAAHVIDPATKTDGGNAVRDQNVIFHAEWDDIPTDIGDAWTRELLADARSALPSAGAVEDWPAQWASDTVRVAHDAFSGLSFQQTRPPPNVQWTVAFNDHTAYLWLADITKRKQLAKGGARLAELLNTIWP
jgi:S1/P1 Nuclease